MARSIQRGNFSFQVFSGCRRGAAEDEPLRAQGNAAVGNFFIQSRGGKMSRGIIAVEGNGDMDAKEGEAGARDAAAGLFGRLELRPQIEEPGLEARIANFLDLAQHVEESIEASGIDGPCIGLRP